MTLTSRSETGGEPLELPGWIWLWLPLVLYFGQYLARLLLPTTIYDTYVTSELGLTEETTTFLLVVSLSLGLLCMRRFVLAQNWRLAAWFGVFALGCLYFGGEEASWGQHWFGYSTPEAWANFNDQQEFNLHNSGNWLGGLLDQLPRNLLSLAALVAGGIMPLVRNARGRHLVPGSNAYWLLPTLTAVPAGLLAALATVPSKLQEAAFGHELIDIDAGEVKELLLAYFLMVYGASVWRRLSLLDLERT